MKLNIKNYIELFTMLICRETNVFPQVYRTDIFGYILDGKTEEPLLSVNLFLFEQPAYCAVIDFLGSFSIKSVLVGAYSLKDNITGCEPSIITNVVVSTVRSTKVLVKLSEQAIEVTGLTVKADYFGRNAYLAQLSVNSYNRAEVKRQPYSAMGMSTISLTAIAKYLDPRIKVIYGISETQTLILDGLLRDICIYIEVDSKRKNLKNAKMNSVYSSLKHVNVEFLNYSALNERDIFNDHSDEQYVALRYDVFYQPHSKHQIALGAQIQTSSTWGNKVYVTFDTTRYITTNNIFVATLGGIIENKLGFGDSNKLFV